MQPPGFRPLLPNPQPQLADREDLMLTCETTIAVDRPGRYLGQLCRHAAAMGQTRGGHRPRNHATGAALASGEVEIHADSTGTSGVVTIAPWGGFTLEAGSGTLTIRVDATDHDALGRIQDIITRDLERFGRRSRLTVTWPPPRPLPQR